MEDQLTTQIQHYFIANGLTLSVAESCTGGALSTQLTRIPGCSNYYLGGVIAYSNALKMGLLHVDPLILSENGAVSGPVAAEMARGVLQLSGSDYSIAVTGIAGPEGGSDSKPVGTIWGAIAKRSAPPLIWKLALQKGARQTIIEQSVGIVLSRLWETVQSSTGE